MNEISITPGKNNVGAYIENIDLKKLNKQHISTIKNTLRDFGVIFVKKQTLDSLSYQNFAKLIGKLVKYPRLRGLENFPYINVIERKPNDKNLTFGSSWLHQDTSYLEDAYGHRDTFRSRKYNFFIRL